MTSMTMKLAISLRRAGGFRSAEPRPACPSPSTVAISKAIPRVQLKACVMVLPQSSRHLGASSVVPTVMAAVILNKTYRGTTLWRTTLR
jgi:hypothetical protein